MAKHYPVIRQMTLSEASPSLNRAIRVIDVGRCLSQANRRLYRYGRCYKSKIDLEADSNTQFEVYALRNDWAVHKGFQLAYEAYVKNASEEAEMMSDSQKARWNDFRARPGIASATYVDVGPVFYQGTVASALVTQGEFTQTAVVDGQGTARTFTWDGTASSTEYGILQEYDKMGNAQTSPSSTLSGMAYDDLNTNVDAAMMNILETHGDNPPYDRDGVNKDNAFVKIATLNSNSPNAQKLSTGFFDAPCGLILIIQTVAEDIREKYTLTVQSGDYKGVNAPSLLE
jgi:hypothetical protein